MAEFIWFADDGRMLEDDEALAYIMPRYQADEKLLEEVKQYIDEMASLATSEEVTGDEISDTLPGRYMTLGENLSNIGILCGLLKELIERKLY